MMKHSTRGYQIEAAGLHRTSDDIALTQFKIGRMRFDKRQIEIKCHCFSARTHVFRQPCRNRSIATSNFKRPRAGLNNFKRLDTPAMRPRYRQLLTLKNDESAFVRASKQPLKKS